jgi:hypothetical protein
MERGAVVGDDRAPQALSAADAPPPVSFVNDVAPILVERCQACHGPEKTKGKYRLDTFDRCKIPAPAASRR